ncbi:MAG: DUF6110 family protein [Coriobacteriales bacterium]|jgi:hypothetical protein|nr:DUF6110 family protein [Coriobacteriales bacterium]
MFLHTFLARKATWVGTGFVMGTLGLKLLKSEPARKFYVRVVSKALQAKAAGQDIIEEAKSNVDDIVAEANYINKQEDEPKAPASSTPARQVAKKK